MMIASASVLCCDNNYRVVVVMKELYAVVGICDAKHVLSISVLDCNRTQCVFCLKCKANLQPCLRRSCFSPATSMEFYKKPTALVTSLKYLAESML